MDWSTFLRTAFLSFIAALLTFLFGCASAYPSVLNSPEMKKAIVTAVEQSNKTWQMEGQVTNPCVEFYYIVGVGARITGVDGRMGAQGAGGPVEIVP